MATASIQSIGTAVPPYKISQQAHYEILESSNGMDRQERLRLQKIYSRSGIETRHSVLEEFGKPDHGDNVLFHPANHHPAVGVSARMDLYEKYASALCEEAINDCINKIPGIQLQHVTHLITFSCTGMYAPGLDMQLVERLGLNRNVERTCINFMGCYAGINALKSAYHIVRSQPGSIVLLAGVELCTLHYQKNEREDQVIANALFADGAAACIVTDKKLLKEDEIKLQLNSFYAEFEPAGKDEMVWKIGDYGFDLKLSIYVPELIRKSIAALVQKLFIRAHISQGDIDLFALHPGGMKILEACEQALGLTKVQNEISYDILRRYGNMSSVTILFVLDEHIKQLTLVDKGKKILACAFGPGLTMESLIAEVA